MSETVAKTTPSIVGIQARLRDLDRRVKQLEGRELHGSKFTVAQTIDVSSTSALLVEDDGTQDNVLVVDTVNGRVGIGTTSPSLPLHVVGSPGIFLDRDTNSWSGITFGQSGTGEARVAFDSNGDINFEVGGVGGTYEAMRIEAGGNVGIGTDSPSSLLELNFATENLELVNAGSKDATEQDWIEVEIGGNTGYIRVHTGK
jgi:hypothetical protein